MLDTVKRESILADHSGQVVQGEYAINRAGFVLHAAVHEHHADIVAMCRAHTVYGGAYASLGKPLPPITQDAACFFKDHVVIADEGGKVAMEVDAGHKVAEAFRGVKATIHQNHGLITARRRNSCRPTRRATAASTWAASTSAGCTSSGFGSSCGRRSRTC